MVSETWYKSVTLNVDKCFEVNFKFDTGAEVNILPLYVLNIVKVKPKLSETNLSLTAYGDFKFKPEGTGEFPDEPYHITLKDNAIPVIHPPRRVPQALQPKLKETLDKLEKEKIVSKVNRPTDRVQSLVIVEKPNGNLRLCLDPRDLNKIINPFRASVAYVRFSLTHLGAKPLILALRRKCCCGPRATHICLAFGTKCFLSDGVTIPCFFQKIGPVH
ncbi:hypothetical protein AVEN_143732-1 [Araneus ventricosus]|uniref:Peptidase A2 domain-containing protein n=1 Tax=Araneus ventricosus TaxID=182803 RepID=A0A4Y2AQD6_ARAVE|nr:hypothetical protein AVEN_143732-1 [Araneus ventricosus]